MGMFVGAATGGRLASLDALHLIWQASWIVQVVLLLLALASIFSWAIIGAKWRDLRRAQQDSEAFLEVYQEGSLDAAYQVAREIGWAASRETLRLERGLSFLATVGSASPFVGLFGTVIGIIEAFEGIGRAGSASLAVVAPGIAEALIATAVGLFAAIPATIFYNHFLGRMRGLASSLQLFAADFDVDLRRQGGAPAEVA
jgi:biopolymer transport protein TolQ